MKKEEYDGVEMEDKRSASMTLINNADNQILDDETNKIDIEIEGNLAMKGCLDQKGQKGKDKINVIGEAPITAIGKSTKIIGNAKNKIEKSLPKPVACFFCCCCWTGSGLRKLVTNGSTLEIVVGFVIGEQFGLFIDRITEIFVTPLIFALFDIQFVTFVSFPGFTVITNPNDIDLDKNNNISATIAINAGCQVIQWDTLFRTFLTLIITLMTLYWLINILKKYSVKDDDDEVSGSINAISRSESVDTVTGTSKFQIIKAQNSLKQSSQFNQCKFCMMDIHFKAVRCPYCTSYVNKRHNINANVHFHEDVVDNPFKK